jgi:hypothetical protein
MGKKGTAKNAKAGQPAPPPTSTAQAKVPAPNWPMFKPKLPVTHLTLEDATSDLADKVVLINNFWPKSLCRDYVSFLKSLPLVTTPARPKRGEAVRVNDRFQVNDPTFSRRLWLDTGLKDAILDHSVAHLW